MLGEGSVNTLDLTSHLSQEDVMMDLIVSMWSVDFNSVRHTLFSLPHIPS
jgi:hypothetical protein